MALVYFPNPLRASSSSDTLCPKVRLMSATSSISVAVQLSLSRQLTLLAITLSHLRMWHKNFSSDRYNDY